MRKYDVNIGGTNWKPKIPDENNVNNQIESILNDNNKTITDKSLSIMCYLMRTQFFSDGNKRTSMLFANKILIENGKGIMIADGIIVVVDFEMPSNDTTNMDLCQVFRHIFPRIFINYSRFFWKSCCKY